MSTERLSSQLPSRAGTFAWAKTLGGSVYFKVLIATAMSVCMLVIVPQAEAAPACVATNFCLDKTVSPNLASVGQPLTFTIRGFCTVNDPATEGCAHTTSPVGNITVTDTLPPGLRVGSATASGVDPATCSTSGNTVTCTPETYCTGIECPTGTAEKDYVEKIVAIPTQGGSFTNTAMETSEGVTINSAQATFTVVGAPRHKRHHRHHHHHHN
jgi:hypothetical protein